MNTPSSAKVIEEGKALCVGGFASATVTLLVVAAYIGVQAIADSFGTDPTAVVLGFFALILVLMVFWAVGTEILDNLEGDNENAE